MNEIVGDHIGELVSAITRAVRENVANELRDYLSAQGQGRGRPPTAGRRAVGRPRRRRILPCIAPGCKQISKGPRFHYLCEKHRDTPKKDYEAWRKNRRAAG